MPIQHTFSFGAAEFCFDPADATPTQIWFKVPAIHLALLERGQALVKGDGDPWAEPGIYFLFGPGDVPGRYRIYVGKAAAGVASRLSQHERAKDWWDRALVVVADRTHGFNEAEIGWLESRFVSKLREDLGEHVTNIQRPRMSRLKLHEEQELEAHVGPIEAVLHLLGVLTPALEPQIVEESEEEIDAALTGHTDIGGPTWVDTACDVLRENGGPMHVRDIVTVTKEQGLRDLSNARTPEATLRRDLRRESQKVGGRVRQTEPATFVLSR
jgi:hypothetical protein